VRYWLLSILAIGVTSFLVSISQADTSAMLADELIDQGWEKITFDGKQPNRFVSCGEGCIEIETNESVSMIGLPVSADLTRMPVLNWEWRIENPVVESDLSEKGKDDRAVALYVTFPYDPETASFSEKMLRPVVEMARGADAPGRVLSYVWGGFGENGDVIESPFLGSVNAMIICRNAKAPVGRWVREEFDVLADHKRVFGFAPTTAAHILLSADSDDMGGANRALVRKIAFRAR